MRATARTADDREAVEPERVGHGEDVERLVRDGTAAVPHGAAVACAVGRDVADACVDIHRLVEHPAVSAAGRSVQPDDRVPVGIATVDVSEHSTVSGWHGSLGLRHDDER